MFSIVSRSLRIGALSLALTACAVAPAVVRPEGTSVQAETQRFLDLHASLFRGQYALMVASEWAASTDLSPAHDAARTASGKHQAALAGDPVLVAQARALLARRAELLPIQVRQLEALLMQAAGSPGNLPELTRRLVEAQGRQSSTLDGFAFCLDRSTDGSCRTAATANDLDRVLRDSRDLTERRRAWEASKEVGKVLKPGLVTLRELRNQVAREAGYSSFFALQVADYGMSTAEMMTLLEGLSREVAPLYRQVTGWARGQLAQRYGQSLPEGAVPAQWIPDRWAQSWPGLVDSADLDAPLRGRSAEWTMQRAEAFYVAMGFDPLPQRFWEGSDLYALPAGGRQKNAHASAWHMDLDQDVRSLMSVEPGAEWFGTAHHELGHIYYFLAYSRPEVPVLLRQGANRAFHEAVGDLMLMAATQPRYLRRTGVLPADAPLPPLHERLLDEALGQGVVFLPWSAGVMSRFEHALYEENLSPEKWQPRWWELVERYQGVRPPEGARATDATLCDACTKTHLNDDPAQYYDYALAVLIRHQLHDHIARRILQQDPHDCDYTSNPAVGRFLRELMAAGATRDWRELLQSATGEPLSSRALRAYFAPLERWLETQEPR